MVALCIFSVDWVGRPIEGNCVSFVGSVDWQSTEVATALLPAGTRSTGSRPVGLQQAITALSSFRVSENLFLVFSFTEFLGVVGTLFLIKLAGKIRVFNLFSPYK